MNNRIALIHQLLAIRSSADAALVLLDVEMEPKEQDCDHPPDARIDFQTMGGPERWECKICGYYYDGSDGKQEAGGN